LFCNVDIFIRDKKAVSEMGRLFLFNYNPLSFHQTKKSILMKPTINSIFKISIGISLIIFSLAAFNLTITKANAAPPTPQQFVEESSNQIGKYQMAIASAKGDGDNKNLWVAMIWDTETGISHTYTESVINFADVHFNTTGADTK
jgi:hypothetical protein